MSCTFGSHHISTSAIGRGKNLRHKRKQYTLIKQNWEQEIWMEEERAMALSMPKRFSKFRSKNGLWWTAKNTKSTAGQAAAARQWGNNSLMRLRSIRITKRVQSHFYPPGTPLKLVPTGILFGIVLFWIQRIDFNDFLFFSPQSFIFE